MQQFNYKKIESIIGYEFNNKKLLKQAFFRSSFAHENNEESNEVLEFIGDKVLDLAVIRILLEKYSKIDELYQRGQIHRFLLLFLEIFGKKHWHYKNKTLE